MRARDLAEDYPLVRLGDPALTAARLIADQHRPAVVVVDDDGMPVTVLPGSQVLRFSVPGYVQDDPSLARVLDEKAADRIVKELDGRTVGDILPKEPHELPVLKGDDTTLELAALMARMRCPLVAIVEDGRVIGVVTTSRLLDKALHV